MKNAYLITWLLIAALLGFAGSALASNLPKCPYIGIFHNCVGSHTYRSGNRYVGEWKNNKQHGQGTYIWTTVTNTLVNGRCRI